jgi:hypothetical protein
VGEVAPPATLSVVSDGGARMRAGTNVSVLLVDLRVRRSETARLLMYVPPSLSIAFCNATPAYGKLSEARQVRPKVRRGNPKE